MTKVQVQMDHPEVKLTLRREANLAQALRLVAEGFANVSEGFAKIGEIFERTEEPAPPAREILTLQESCQYLGCGKTKFYQLIAQGEVPEGAHVGGRRQWNKLILDGYIQRRFAKLEEKESVKRLRLPKR